MMKGLIITVAVVLVLGLLGFWKYVSVYNQGNALERQVISEFEVLKSTLSTHTNKVIEVASVTEMYRDDLRQIVEDTFTGRYGANGSQARLMQFIQEKNPTFDADLYKKIQQVMEIGRDQINNAQKRVIDTNRTYITLRGTFLTGSILSFAGFPKSEEYKEVKVIISESASEAARTGVDGPVLPRRIER